MRYNNVTRRSLRQLPVVQFIVALLCWHTMPSWIVAQNTGEGESGWSGWSAPVGEIPSWDGWTSSFNQSSARPAHPAWPAPEGEISSWNGWTTYHNQSPECSARSAKEGWCHDANSYAWQSLSPHSPSTLPIGESRAPSSQAAVVQERRHHTSKIQVGAPSWDFRSPTGRPGAFPES